MALRKGLVVETHVEDNSVDLIMADNGDRLIGVQVLCSNASSRTGRADLPMFPTKKKKWDASERTDQDMIALVDTVGRGHEPVVTGFLFPQINEILPKKGDKRLVDRHQSDVMYFIDGNGNIQLDHPSGLYVRIGENADREVTEGKNADENSHIDRNTERRVNVRIGLAGGKGTLTITPDGKVTFDIQSDFEVLTKGNVKVNAGGSATVTAESVTLDAAKTEITGDLHVVGKITCDDDVVASDVSLVTHIHGGVANGGSTTNPPVS